jgi:hypothetical protein
MQSLPADSMFAANCDETHASLTAVNFSLRHDRLDSLLQNGHTQRVNRVASATATATGTGTGTGTGPKPKTLWDAFAW